MAPERGRVPVRGMRSSVRSRGSSSTTSDPREKVKDCCRKLVAFMCTQVGVGGLVVCYAIMGAWVFIAIETQEEYKQISVVQDLRTSCASDLWNITTIQNVFNETSWRLAADRVLKNFQNGVVRSMKKGYSGQTVKEMWSFPAALMFSLSIFTMIGYGNLVPRSNWGKVATMLYAVFGIPLYVLYFMNMGKVLAQTFRWLYTKLYQCSLESSRKIGKDGEEEEEDDLEVEEAPRVIVPSTACLWVLAGYILTGTIMFAEWEKWNYLDSSYFCVTSLCKIGIGDFVPGANILESREGSQTKLVINFIYLLLGMGLIAMCYNLMREEVRVKMSEIKRDLSKWVEEVRLRAVGCFKREEPPGRRY